MDVFSMLASPFRGVVFNKYYWWYYVYCWLEQFKPLNSWGNSPFHIYFPKNRTQLLITIISVEMSTVSCPLSGISDLKHYVNYDSVDLAAPRAKIACFHTAYTFFRAEMQSIQAKESEEPKRNKNSFCGIDVAIHPLAPLSNSEIKSVWLLPTTEGHPWGPNIGFRC